MNKNPKRVTKETTKIILEYLEKFPNSPSKTLATKIYSEHGGYFEKFDNVYTRVRYYRGQMGSYHRKRLNNKEFQKELKTKVMQNFVSLPTSLSEKRGTFTFPTGCKKLFMGNLSYNIDDDTIVDFFKDCGGDVIGLRWLTRKGTEEFRGCGFIEFSSSEAADEAIKKDGLELLGRPIRLDWDA
jgi:hypothetical protein